MKYDDAYIDKFRKDAIAIGLYGVEMLDMLTNDEIRENINGIGAACMPQVIRTLLDNLNPCLVYPSHIHDLEWVYMCDGGISGFYESNWHFLENGIMVAKWMYGWWRPARYVAIGKAKEARRILDSWGFEPYVSTIRKTLTEVVKL